MLSIKKLNERGSILDSFWVFGVLFALAIILLVFVFIGVTIADTNIFSGNFINIKGFFVTIGNALPIGILLVILLAAGLAYSVKIHPVFLVAGFFFLIVLFLLAAGLSMGWGAISDSMPNTAATIPFLDLFMKNIHIISIAGGVLILIAAYMGYKSQSGWG